MKPSHLAFTLIGLLVVIAIIAILAGLLFCRPWLRRKPRGRRFFCLNQLKHLSLGAKLYSGDNDDPYVWSFSLIGNQQNRRSRFNYLYGYQETKAALRCPSKPFKTKETLSDIERTTNNYAANFRLVGCDWPGTWELPSIKESAVRKPSTVVYKTEAGTQPVNTDDPLRCVTEKYREKSVYWIVHDPGNIRPCNGYVTSGDPNWGEPHLRDSGRSNVSFTNGHAEVLRSSVWYWYGTPWLDPDRRG